MPRYFLHIDNGRGRETDEDGRDYLKPELAIAEAARMAGELVRNEAIGGATTLEATIHVEDTGGVEIARVHLSVSSPA